MDALQSTNDRRERQRYGINAPLTVFMGKTEIPGFTQNLNNMGVYFFMDLADKATITGDFEFLIELPPEVTLSTSCLVRCRGRAIRADRDSTRLTGIAARILEYSIEREDTLSA
jgi:hypothetical protein